jgi:hypothetical protein
MSGRVIADKTDRTPRAEWIINEPAELLIQINRMDKNH